MFRRYARYSLALGAAASALLALTMILLGSPAGAAPGDNAADRVFGQWGNFDTDTINHGGISASSLANPLGIAVDADGNVYVADDINNRVLQYDNPLENDNVADRVFGQLGSFDTDTCRKGGVTASSLCLPTGVAVDAAGNLYVADYFNNRVLEYDTPVTSDTDADRVFGQPDFISRRVNNGGMSASSLFYPVGVAVDAAGNLYVGDYYNHRVLEYDNALVSDTVADRVFGQLGSFDTKDCYKGGVTASSLCFFGGGQVAVDGAGNLYVADAGANRVLEYDTPVTTDTDADRVFGQPDFTSQDANNGGIGASSLNHPDGVAVDSAGNVYVSDTHNNRVLKYDTPLTNGTEADRVFGQLGSFTTDVANDGVISASSLKVPRFGVAVDAAGNVYIADPANHRVLEYDNPEAPAPSCPAWPGLPYGLPEWPIPEGDSDCDGFPDTVADSSKASEADIGTDPLRQCAMTTTPNDEVDAMPPDFDDDRVISGKDAGKFGGPFGAYNHRVSDGPFGPPGNELPGERFDFNGDGIINGRDSGKFQSYYNEVCTP